MRYRAPEILPEHGTGTPVHGVSNPPITEREPAPYWDEEVFDPPRWEGAGPHCQRANMQAFESRKEAEAFMESIAVPAKRFLVCPYCGWWHAESAFKRR